MLDCYTIFNIQYSILVVLNQYSLSTQLSTFSTLNPQSSNSLYPHRRRSDIDKYGFLFYTLTGSVRQILLRILRTAAKNDVLSIELSSEPSLLHHELFSIRSVHLLSTDSSSIVPVE